MVVCMGVWMYCQVCGWVDDSAWVERVDDLPPHTKKMAPLRREKTAHIEKIPP